MPRDSAELVLPMVFHGADANLTIIGIRSWLYLAEASAVSVALHFTAGIMGKIVNSLYLTSRTSVPNQPIIAANLETA
jgi:hypothetical protein